MSVHEHRDDVRAGGPEPERLSVWPEPPAQVSLVPAVVPGFDGWAPWLAFGLNPRRLFDAGYRDFLHSVAAQLGTAMAEASANEAERRAPRL